MSYSTASTPANTTRFNAINSEFSWCEYAEAMGVDLSSYYVIRELWKTCTVLSLRNELFAKYCELQEEINGQITPTTTTNN